MEKYISPEGEEFIVEEQATNRILNEGIPFIIVDIKERRLTIKEDDLFVYADARGNITSDNTAGLGFYTADTRFLSCWELFLNGREPILLSTGAQRDYMAHIELTNADITEGEQLKVPQETINIRRLRVLAAALQERIRIKNYNPVPVDLFLEFAFFADFADMFEIRGMRRTKRGRLFKPKLSGDVLILAYLGQDDIFRQTRIDLPGEPDSHRVELNKIVVGYSVRLEKNGRAVLNFSIRPATGDTSAPVPGFNRAISNLRSSYQKWERSCTLIETDNELFNSVLERGRDDLRSLMTGTNHGSIICAGIPWYVALFGRDSLIAALQTMPLNPEPARNTLEMLAVYQGKEVDLWRDEEPGKIMHELRQGELASLGEIPHTPYYGSIDSTPLFLLMMTEYYKWTGDLDFIKRHKQAILAGLTWIDEYGDADGDGFIEYQRKSRRGLINQGWKDSHNAVIHDDGEMARAPIALSEVQAYVYYAKKRLVQLFRDLGDEEISERLAGEAAELKKRFNEAFWLEDIGFYAMALDGEKRQVKTVSSNPGQCLWSGIADEEKAAMVAKKLVAPPMFTGWGIRTVSKDATIYNPMSYHNGSVWPHDNAIIASGLMRYGFVDEAHRLITSMLDAAAAASGRLPELFAGVSRDDVGIPVSYPTSCSPQAWAAATPLLFLRLLLRFDPQVRRGRLWCAPSLPPGWERLVVQDIPLAGRRVSVTVAGHEWHIDGLGDELEVIPRPREPLTAEAP